MLYFGMLTVYQNNSHNSSKTSKYILEYLRHKWPQICSTSRSFPHSWLITGFVTRLTRLVPLVEQELLILPEHLSSPPVCSGVRVTRSLVLCVCLVDRWLSLCTFSFGHCVVCSSIYGFWLPLWYLQTLFSICLNLSHLKLQGIFLIF